MNKPDFVKIDERHRITMPSELVPENCIGYQIDKNDDGSFTMTPIILKAKKSESKEKKQPT